MAEYVQILLQSYNYNLSSQNFRTNNTYSCENIKLTDVRPIVEVANIAYGVIQKVEKEQDSRDEEEPTY